MEAQAICAKQLTFAYPGNDETPSVQVLKGLDLSVEAGTFVAVLGHNGCGKSTLAKHFNAILLPSGGQVYVWGMDTGDEELLMKIRKSVGMVFQNPDNQLISNVVEEDVAFAPENLGIPSENIRQRVDLALKQVGMYQYRSHAPHLLSGGQKQRIAIAGVLAMHPKCIVLDEPTAMLDPQGRKEVVSTVKRLVKEHGMTVVLITHHMSEAAQADRVVVMDDGNIIADGTPKEVFTQVELLQNARLTVPETTKLIYELRKAGWDLPLEALSTEECAQALCRALKD